MFLTLVALASSLGCNVNYKVANTWQYHSYVEPTSHSTYLNLTYDYIIDAPYNRSLGSFYPSVSTNEAIFNPCNIDFLYVGDDDNDAFTLTITISCNSDIDVNYMCDFNYFIYDDVDNLVTEDSYMFSLYYSTGFSHVLTYSSYETFSDITLTLSADFYFLSEDIFNAITSQYNLGYTNGHSDGYIEGKTDGYAQGNATGRETGYDLGYADGVAQVSGGYNLINLFGTIADTPIMMLHGMFNFDIFGINVLTLILSLLTSLMLLFVVKKIWK